MVTSVVVLGSQGGQLVQQSSGWSCSIAQKIGLDLSSIAVVVHRIVIQSVGQSRLIKNLYKFIMVLQMFGDLLILWYFDFYFNWNGHTYNFLHNCRIQFVR